MKNWSLLTIANVVQTIIGFIVLVRVARVLTPSEYGIYVLLISITTIAQTIGTLSLRNISIREIARNPHSLPIIAKKSFFLISGATFISSICMVVYLFFISNITDKSILLFSTVFLVSQSLWSFCESLAFAKQQMYPSTVLIILSSLLWCICVFILPIELFTVTMIWSLFAGIQLFRSIMYLIYEWRNNYFLNSNIDYFIKTKDLLMQSLPILGSAVLALPLTQIPLLLLSHYSGNFELGSFGLGNRLTQPLYILSGTLFSVLYPSLAANYVRDKNEFAKKASVLFILLSLIGILISITVTIFSAEAIRFLFGMKYESAIEAFAIQIWVVVNWIMHNYLGILFVASNNEKRMVQLSLVNAVLIGCASIIGSHYGAVGLSLSLWISGLIGFSIHWIILRRQIPELSFGLIHWKIFVSYILFSLISFFVTGISVHIRVALIILIIILSLLLFNNYFHNEIKIIRKKGITVYLKGNYEI